MKRVLFPLPILVVSLAVAGCASVKTISVNQSEPHPAIPAKDVQLVLAPPTDAVLVADIISESCNSEQGADAAQADLKRKAASLGANVLVVEGSNQYVDLTSEGVRIEAKAYYVPPSDNGK